MGANVVQRSCPNCGAPVSPQHTLMQCEFCGSPLILVKPQQAPPPPPVSPFAAYGGNVLPAPPHIRRRTTSAGPAVFIAMAGVLIMGASTAFFVLGSAPKHPPPDLSPPSQPTTVAEPPPVAIAPGAGIADQAKMFEAQCNGGNAQSCVMAGALYEHGPNSSDRAKARALYERACTLGDPGGCHMRDAMKK